MNEKNKSGLFSNKAKDRLYSVGTVVTRVYDRSILASLTFLTRKKALTLHTRTIGVFLITFGIYAFLIGLLTALFTRQNADTAELYGAASLILCSLPLLFSKENLSTTLTKSRVGSVICDYLDVRRERLDQNTFSGHMSVAFVLGVIAGALTLLFPLTAIILALVLITVISIILCTPETGLTFISVSLFITDERIQFALIGTTLLSYAFKCVRSKRKFLIKKADVPVVIFTAATAAAAFITTYDTKVSVLSYQIAFILPYFLCICLLRDAKKITKFLTLSVISAGTLASLYIFGFCFSKLIPAGFAADRQYLLELVNSLPSFSEDFAPFAFAILIPVCTAFIIKPRSEGYRFTLTLCMIAMVCCLFVTEKFAFLAVAFVSTAILLLITGSRRIYFFLAAAMTVMVTLAFAGSFGDRLYGYISRHIYEAYHQAEITHLFSEKPISNGYVFCGGGLSENISEGSFYYSIISKLGIAGFLIFLTIVIFIAVEAVLLIIKTYRKNRLAYRFASTDENAETRMGIIAVICSLLSVFICATFHNLYASKLSYLAFFLLLGVCAAYTRAAVKLMNKAEESEVRENTPTRATAVIGKAHN